MFECVLTVSTPMDYANCALHTQVPMSLRDRNLGIDTITLRDIHVAV
jgi:hypothetical protein